MLNKFDSIFWDFDGVLMNSNSIRDYGFFEVLREYSKETVDSLLSYHRANGGLSRYHKFRYFYEVILGKSVTNEIIGELALRFSAIMKEKLQDPSLIIDETTSFIKRNYHSVPMFVVSGSDERELRELCEAHGLKNYFKGIYGSPTPKKELVKNILNLYSYEPSKCLLIGDSINDFEAAKVNNLQFMAYNNDTILHLSTVNINLLS